MCPDCAICLFKNHVGVMLLWIMLCYRTFSFLHLIFLWCLLPSEILFFADGLNRMAQKRCRQWNTPTRPQSGNPVFLFLNNLMNMLRLWSWNVNQPVCFLPPWSRLYNCGGNWAMHTRVTDDSRICVCQSNLQWYELRQPSYKFTKN